MESRKKIIFLGDSITDAGHDLQMAPEGQSRLGDGYVSRIAAMLGVDEVDTADREGTRARIVCMGPFIFPWPLEYRNWITVDGVHLTGRGAELIAREWLRRTEFRKKEQ